jgi:hypothetical protein
MGEMRNAYKILARKSEGMRPHGTHGHRCENNIESNFRETVCRSVDHFSAHSV